MITLFLIIMICENSRNDHFPFYYEGIYDDKKNLIAVAKLAKPVRKSEERDFTFKIKLDI